MITKETYACQHCGAEADITLEGFEKVEDVIRRTKKGICKTCGKEVEIEAHPGETFACRSCGAEADMTLEGFESVEDVIKREKGLHCHACGKEILWSDREEIKAVRVAMEAEKEAYQAYSKAAKMTKNPRGKDMFQQLSEFEMNHYQKLKGLLKSLEEKGEWILYEGKSFQEKKIPLKAEKPKGQEQLTDLDALKIAIREEKKARAYYRSMAELTKDPRGKDMYKRLASEEELHEKLLNDQYYSLHNTGIWSWGD
ncbi:MAG: ferritin family protein [Thermodesulfobacteriota bacterium]|nr:ferritin family protein [Thermodesulfobacteriota bacterium]